MFYCAMNEEGEAIVWQDGEQTLNPETGEIEPINFIPDFVCEWDGTSQFYTGIYGERGIVPETAIIDPRGELVTVPAHLRDIPFAGWDSLVSEQLYKSMHVV